MEPMLWRRMKMGNIALRAGVEPESLAFQANVLTISPPRLPVVTTLSGPPVSVDYYSIISTWVGGGWGEEGRTVSRER